MFILNYVVGKPSEDAYVRKLDNAVKMAKANKGWKVLNIRGMSTEHRKVPFILPDAIDKK